MVGVPIAFTRRRAKEQTWRVWAQEWGDLEHGSGMDMGEDKAYLRFVPMLEYIKEAVWKGGKVGGHRRVLQLLLGHCNLAGYLHSRGKRHGAQCDNCGRGEKEDVEHYLLHCPRSGAQRQEMSRQEMSDLIVQNDAQASMANMLKEVGRLARFVRSMGRLDF